MIVPMKKISIFVKRSDRTDALLALRKLGVLHINEKSGRSQKVEDLLVQQDEIRRVTERIEQTFPSAVKNTTHRVEEKIRYNEVMHKRKDLISLIDEENELRNRNLFLRQEIDRITPWGDFSPSELAALHQDHGYDLTLYTVQNDLLENLDQEIPYLVISRDKKSSKIAIIGNDLPESDDFIKFVIPEKSISGCKNEIDANEKRAEEIMDLFYDEIRYLSAYKEVASLIEEEIIFEKVKHNMDSTGTVVWLTGFIPEEEISEVQKMAKKQSWGLLIDDIDEKDQVPTKLKNNKFVRMIQPVFDILGTVPGYREYDVSLFFLMFFAIFFAMIIGDAGYGMLFLAGAVALNIATKQVSEANKLLYVLSGTTVIWGSMTGTWFGSSGLLQAVPLLQGLVVPQISTFTDIFADITTKQSQDTIIFISFLLGIMQLALACIINFFRELPQKKAVAQLGWMTMLIGLYILVLNLVIPSFLPEFPGWGTYLIGIGFVVFVLFYEQQEDSFLKGLLRGLGGLFNTFLDAISGFSNIISYIRLFAVGMASVAISSSFNEMAGGLLGGWTIPFAIIVLLFGHGLNIIMSLLSVVVHGIRLNMLEFSGQLGMEWTGIKYEPFKENIDASVREYSQNSNTYKE